MIQDRNPFYDSAHYFDCNGAINSLKTSSNKENSPKRQSFILKNGRITQLFLINNPWRATSEAKDDQIVYQYCVFCKEKRFEDELFCGTVIQFEPI